MIPSNRPVFKRINLSEPEDMKNMLRSGMLWEHPQFWQEGFTALESGLLPLSECKDVPPQVVEYLNGRVQPAEAPASDFSKNFERLQGEAQAPVVGATDEDDETISGWTCPMHGNDDVRNLKSPKGREYLACGVPRCKEFQRAPGAPVNWWEIPLSGLK